VSLIRKAFYSSVGNKVARTLVSPVKSLVPPALHFPVSGQISVPVEDFQPLKLRVNPTCFLGKVLFWEGMDGFEPAVHRVFRSLIGRSDMFLDIGANIGFYSLLAAKYNPAAKVHCFEPLPASFGYLSANIQLNQAHSVQAHRLALSNETGPTTFFYAINPKFPFIAEQLTSTGSLDQEQANRTTELAEAQVDQVTLDEFVPSLGPGRIDLIKLDTEATEHLVMDGARATITAHRPIILCEVLPGKVEKEIQSRVEAMQYVPYRITDRGLLETNDLSHGRAEANDYLFCPSEKKLEISDLLA
jgi:FkbM family methyltransferase